MLRDSSHPGPNYVDPDCRQACGCVISRSYILSPCAVSSSPDRKNVLEVQRSVGQHVLAEGVTF